VKDIKPKKKPTLKELMIIQGKIKPQTGPAAKPATPKTPPPAQAAVPKTKWQETRDHRIKKMIEQDPEQAAELLKKLFLNKD